jgi:hypothetical protein
MSTALLERAAKAAGVETRHGFEGKLWRFSGDASWSQGWNPLTDDGDAFRLAARLELAINHSGKPGKRIVEVSADDGEFCTVCAMELLADDPCAATRLAIVRAAASLIDDA